MATPTKEQMEVVHHVAEAYWQGSPNQVTVQLVSIKVLKSTGGKVAGILPAHGSFPSVFFKVYFYDRGFRFETAGLQAAAAMPPFEGIRVPSVIAILPEYKAILMEKRAWEDTSSPWKRLWVNKLGIDWYKVGTWLRAFHDSQTTYEKNDYFLRKKFEKFESHLNDLKHLFNPDQVEKMNHIYQFAREYFEKNECEWVISHGDIALANIKRAGSMLEIIDFEDCQSALREFDLVNLATRTDYTGFSPNHESRQKRLIRKFFEGYGMQPSPSPVTNFFYLLVKMDMIESYFRRRNEKVNSLFNHLMYYHFEKKGINNLVEWLSTLK